MIKSSCTTLVFCLVLVGLGGTDSKAVSVTFAFTEGSPLDNVTSGATMTRDNGDPANAITLTTLTVGAPLYDSLGSHTWTTGLYDETLAKSNIISGNGLGVDNAYANNTTWSSESQSFNPGEYITFAFDRPIIFEQILFSSLGANEHALVTIGANSWSFTNPSGGAANNPFSGLFIPAGTPIRFANSGNPTNPSDPSSWRITSFTVTPAPPLELEINRITGEMILRNVSTASIPFFGYQIDSALGALDPSQWKTIADNYDAGSPEQIDPDDDWTTLTPIVGNFSYELSEEAFGGPGQAGNGMTLAPGQSVNLGPAWIPTPFEGDITVLQDISQISSDITVKYVGNGGQPLALGDLNHNGTVDTADWLIFNSNDPSGSLAFTSFARAYSMGDLDGDLDIDTVDYRLFEAAYDLANGEGSFFAMLDGQTIPEPSTLLLVALGLPLAVALRRHAWLRVCLLGILVACLAGERSQAQSVVFGFPNNSEFDDMKPVGTSMVRSPNGGPLNRITLTTTNLRAPQYTNPTGTALEWDGVTYLTAFTTINSAGGLGVDNPGAGNDPAMGGLSPLNDLGMNEFESMSLEFNRHVRILEFDFTSITPQEGDQGEVSVEGLVSPLLFNAATLDGDIDLQNPFGSLVIPPGADITFTGLGSNVEGGTSVWRLSGITVQELFPQMTARVNSLSGEVLLTNTGEIPIPLDSYEIRSSDGALKIGNSDWNSLSDQGLDTIGPGIGQSWDEGNNVSSSIVVERFLRGQTALQPGEFVSLGNLFDLNIGSIENLSLFFSDKQTHALNGLVELFTPPQGLPGDFNNDGFVNLADYTVWRDNLGAADDSALNGNGDGLPGVNAGDYSLWKTHFGNSAGSVSAIDSQQVPEPGAALLLMISCSLFGMRVCRARR